MKLTHEDLISILPEFFENLSREPSYFTSGFDLLKNVGCRWIELFEVKRWRKEEDFYFSLQPAKGNDLRYVNITLVNRYFEMLIEDDKDYAFEFRYHKMSYYFNRHFPHKKLSVGNKEVSLHLFRYLNIYQKMQELDDVAQVAAYFGEVDEKNILLYLNAEFNY